MTKLPCSGGNDMEQLNQCLGVSVDSTELIVIIYSSGFYGAGYIGSRAMLEAVGMIHEDIVWPHGFDSLFWTQGNFNYWLRRQRPAGAKGPRRDFLDCDWWTLRWEMANAPCLAERNIQLKVKELKAEIYRHTPAGLAERREQENRHLAAVLDKKFQAFKTLVPGLVPPKRTRRTRSATKSKCSPVVSSPVKDSERNCGGNHG